MEYTPYCTNVDEKCGFDTLLLGHQGCRFSRSGSTTGLSLEVLGEKRQAGPHIGDPHENTSGLDSTGATKSALGTLHSENAVTPRECPNQENNKDRGNVPDLGWMMDGCQKCEVQIENDILGSSAGVTCGKKANHNLHLVTSYRPVTTLPYTHF